MRLVLEFGAQSQFQLSHDALKAFPADLQEKSEIFYWPVVKRCNRDSTETVEAHASGSETGGGDIESAIRVQCCGLSFATDSRMSFRQVGNKRN